MSTTELVLLIVCSNLVSLIAGMAFIGWLTRQKSPTLTLDAIKGATAILNAAAAEATSEVTTATQRKEAVDLALKHAAASLAVVAA